MKNFLLRATSFILIFYFCLLVFLYFFQELLIFHPHKLDSGHVFSLPDVKEVQIPVPGAKLSALHLKLDDPDGVIFFLHGNAGNVDLWLTDTSFYREVNYDLVILDYRGYGKSTGRIQDEKQLLEDVNLAWNYVEEQYKDKKKVVYGRSIGAPLAAYLSSIESFDYTILVSPFYDMKEMLKLYYPYVPTFLLRYQLNTAKYVREIKNPVIIFHGENDQIVPVEHSIRLNDENENSNFYKISQAGHNDIHLYPEYYRALSQFLNKDSD